MGLEQGPVLHADSAASFLRKAQESQKEMKLLLDMYKSAPKEQRDKVQLMAAEKKTKAEVRQGRGLSGDMSLPKVPILLLTLCHRRPGPVYHSRAWVC